MSMRLFIYTACAVTALLLVNCSHAGAQREESGPPPGQSFFEPHDGLYRWVDQDFGVVCYSMHGTSYNNDWPRQLSCLRFR